MEPRAALVFSGQRRDELPNSQRPRRSLLRPCQRDPGPRRAREGTDGPRHPQMSSPRSRHELSLLWTLKPRIV